MFLSCHLSQRSLLIKKQQRRRADARMVTANHDIRPKTRKQKAEADDKALLISQSQSNTSLNGLYTNQNLVVNIYLFINNYFNFIEPYRK